MPAAKKSVDAGRSAEEESGLSPQRVLDILEARARAAARVPAQALEAGAILEVMRFSLGQEAYALETSCIREVLRPKEITPLPGTPAFLAGIANLRGQILAVLDLRHFFGLAAAADTALSRVIVLGRERVEFGVLADAVHEVALLRTDAIADTPGSVSGAAREYVRGVTAGAMILLDGAALLDDPRLVIDLSDDG